MTERSHGSRRSLAEEDCFQHPKGVPVRVLLLLFRRFNIGRDRLRSGPMTRRGFGRFRIAFGIYNILWLYVAALLGVSRLPYWEKGLLFIPLFVGGPTLEWLYSYENYVEKWRRRRGLPVGHNGDANEDNLVSPKVDP